MGEMNQIRYELKFVLNELQLNELLVLIKQQKFKKQFPKRTVKSLYFDNNEYSSVKDNISGISKRKKIRLRWYDESDQPPIIEIKKRLGRIGDKLYLKAPFNSGKEIEVLSANKIFTILKKSNYHSNQFILISNLNPTLFVVYNREYMISNEGIRLTIDKKIQFSQASHFNPICNQKKFRYNKNIVEIKFPINKKKSINKILKSTGLAPSRHSKYLAGLSVLGISSYI